MDKYIDYLLLQKRIIHIEGPIDDPNANLFVAKLIYLNEPPYNDAFLFINSPGGLFTPCVSVYDTLKSCNYKINTICLGTVASAAALLLAAGSKGMRYAFSNSVISPSLYPYAGNDIFPEQLKLALDKVLNVYSDLTGNDIEIMRALCFGSHSLKPTEALNYGYIDKIIDAGMINTAKPDFFEIVDLIKQNIKI